MFKKLFSRPGAISAERFSLVLALLLATVYNVPLWKHLLQLQTRADLHTAVFLLSCFVVLVAFLNLLLSAVAFRFVQFPVAALILLTAPIPLYFMQTYGVVIDQNMIQNVSETDPREAGEQLSAGLLLCVLLLGVLPVYVLGTRINLTYRPFPVQLLRNAGAMAASALVIGSVAFFFYPDYASLFRNHRELRLMVNPTNYLYAGAKYIAHSGGSVAHAHVQPLGQDAVRAETWQQHQRKSVTIVVLGETARAENFGLNGYHRNTTPELSKQKVVNFSHVQSCGTATAVSVPCMFSMYARDEYDSVKAKSVENILDVIARAGVKVLWRDNNTGCKGVCDRVVFEDLSDPHPDSACGTTECFDEVLLHGLDALIENSEQDLLLVLHQKGSHGPAYNQRVPDRFKIYQPACKSAELQNCSREEILNAYDNTILYTDYVLSQLIDRLRSMADRYDTAVLYVSDHGESLGEDNLYLHGTPYFMAPEQQTHVPFFVWLSDAYKADFGVSEACLRERTQDRIGHEHIFHSLLGLLAIRTSVYRPERDIFHGCTGTAL